MKKDKMIIDTNKRNVENELRRYAKIPLDDVYLEYKTSINGLNPVDVDDLATEYGKNVITLGRKNTKFRRLISSIINPFNVILLIIAVITFVFDVLLASKGQEDYLTFIIIIVLVFVSSLVAFIQAEKSNDATEKLTKMISNRADVIRNGVHIEVLMEDVLPGDIVKLTAGDMIPADVRFITTKDTFVAQSALTGESNPVEKFSELEDISNKNITDFENIGFMGSNIVSGVSLAIVLSTGNDTYFGSMAEQLTGKPAKSSFEQGVQSISSLLIRMMIVMIPVVLLINGIIKKDWLEALMFSVSIAVGLTPEMLPVIMTSTLAKGAVTMSKHKVIVKNLGSIQTFGQMDILCTDKTGTLTEDKIILERYMNVHGQDDYRVLRHAYLNSYFQTGLKNMIDIAIINRANIQGVDQITSRYNREDEIPFDFARRRMSVVLVDEKGKRQLITKGAVEEMLEISSFVEIDGKVVPLTEESKAIALNTYQKHNNDGLRMIAVAQKNEVPDEHNFGVEDESDMVLIGFIGFLDPPKESSKAAIEALSAHGVRTIVLTGDSEGVAIKVCKKVGINTDNVLLGIDVEQMTDEELKARIQVTDLMAKLSPNQKERVVKLYQELGHTVGFMGDGINDALAIRQADVGISVDSAVDIAKETADIILLEKDLMVLEEGVIEGRKTYGNVNKYIQMAVSGNFGNMISVVIASIFLPFLPMLPVQILVQNLLSDFSQLGIPFDNVDKSYIEEPRKWDTKSITRFMFWFGPISSIFDVATFAVMYYVIGKGMSAAELAPVFQAGWFIFGTLSQILIVHVIRTKEIPFIKSNASKPLVFSSLIIGAIACVVAFTGVAISIDMAKLPLLYIPMLTAILLGYMLLTQLVKVVYIKKYDQWL
ncbi:MAG TPA: magnesium-translocating P-type ATPase [Haploplasma sp.]|nr:magnesium-translocating P-type ATPase [Haploplasma sp.]